MAEQITLSPVGSLIDTTTAQTTINNNFTTIQDAFVDVLSLTGIAPNAMEENLDMNSNQILNLPAPATLNSPARLTDLIQANGGGAVTNIPAGGTTGQVLAKNSNQDYDIKWEGLSPDDITGGLNITTTGNNPTVIATISNPVFSTSVTTPLLKNTGTLTLPTSTDTLVGRATTDTLTNKTLTTPVMDRILTSTTPNTSLTGILTNNQGATAGIAAGFAIIGDTFSPTPFPTHGQINLCSQANSTTIQGGSPAAAATLTLPNATDTIVGRLSADTLTNKTINGASNTLTVLGASQISGNIPVSNLASGSGASSATFWRGDGIWSAPPTGSVIFLEQLTAAGGGLQSTVSWAPYSSIEIRMFNLLPTTSSTGTIAFQFNTAGGLQSTNYLSQTQQTNNGSSTVSNLNGSTGFIPLIQPGIQTNSGNGVSGVCTAFSVNTANNKSINSLTTGNNATNITSNNAQGTWNGSAVVTGMLMTFTTTNIASGFIRIYGIV